MARKIELFRDTQPDDAYADVARREAYAKALQEMAARQRGPAPGGRVQAQYGIGEGLTQLAEALLARRAGRQAIETRNAADANTRVQNEGVINDLTMDQRPQKIDAQGQPIPGTEPQQMLNIDTGRPELSARGQALARAVAGQDPQQIRQFLMQQQLSRMLPPDTQTVLPYGSKLVDRNGGVLASNERSTSPSMVGSSADMQLFRYIKEADPTLTDGEVMERARAYKETFANATRAGIGGVVGNRSGAFTPQTDINAVASNAEATNRAGAAGTKAGTVETEKFFDKPRALAAVNEQNAKTDLFLKKINDLATDPGLERATGLWAYIPSIYGGKAANVEAATESLKAQLGFTSLQQMRSESKTGGALGNVSDRDIAFLQQEFVSLAKSQSKEQFIEGLRTIATYLAGAKQRRTEAFNADYANARDPNAHGENGSQNPPTVRFEDLSE